jgi:rhombotail lipoprotein
LASLKGNSLTELRNAAARYGVDWILVFDGAAAVDRYNNYKAGLLYWTVLGAYLADGTHSDALCIMKASLWDVKTGARLMMQQTDGMTKKVGPAALVDDGEEIERARKLALDALLQQLTEQFAVFTGTRQ